MKNSELMLKMSFLSTICTELHAKQIQSLSSQTSQTKLLYFNEGKHKQLIPCHSTKHGRKFYTEAQ